MGGGRGTPGGGLNGEEECVAQTPARDSPLIAQIVMLELVAEKV